MTGGLSPSGPARGPARTAFMAGGRPKVTQ